MKKNSIFDPLDLHTLSQIDHYLASQPEFSPQGLSPLWINGRRYGWLENIIVTELLNLSSQWLKTEDKIELHSKNLAESLQMAAQHLYKKGLILGWRNESYGVYSEDTQGEADFFNALCALERASFRRFGFLSRAVHINAYYPDGTLCLGQRAENKGIDPNKLDNMAAGGIPINENIHDCAIRELAEEAGVTFDIAKSIQFAETLHLLRNESDGTHNEILYCFDLALPEDFIPHNQDGEVAAFYRLSPADAVNRLKEMTWDAGKVTASFLLRQQRLR